MRTGMLSAICVGIEGSEWEELHFDYTEMSKETGAKKPSECQKSESLGL